MNFLGTLVLGSASAAELVENGGYGEAIGKARKRGVKAGVGTNSPAGVEHQVKNIA